MDGNQIAIWVARCDLFIITILKHLKFIMLFILILLLGLVLFAYYKNCLNKKKEN